MMAVTHQFYRLESPRIPWGDYGNILHNGMSCHLEREDGLIRLERTGPFIPPITFPGIGDIVVVRELRQKLEKSGLTGYRFAPLIKERIVHLEWDQWNAEAEEPAEYPESGEPEDYILERPHSQAVAVRMPILNELVIESEVACNREQAFAVVAADWQGQDFFRVCTTAYAMVSNRAKEWLEVELGKWVRLVPHPVI